MIETTAYGMRNPSLCAGYCAFQFQKCSSKIMIDGQGGMVN